MPHAQLCSPGTKPHLDKMQTNYICSNQALLEKKKDADGGADL